MKELLPGTPVIYVSSFAQNYLCPLGEMTQDNVDVLEAEAKSGSTNINLGWAESVGPFYARCRFLIYSRDYGWRLRTRANSELCSLSDLLPWDHSQSGAIESEFKPQITAPLVD